MSGTDVFKFDTEYEANEEKYKALKKEILDEGSSDEEGGSESGSASSSDEEGGDDEGMSIIARSGTFISQH